MVYLISPRALLFIGLCFSQSKTQEKYQILDIENALSSSLKESLKVIVRNSFKSQPKEGIPIPFDPLIANLSLKYVNDGDLLKLKLQLSDIVLEGLSTLSIQEISFVSPKYPEILENPLKKLENVNGVSAFPLNGKDSSKDERNSAENEYQNGEYYSEYEDYYDELYDDDHERDDDDEDDFDDESYDNDDYLNDDSSSFLVSKLAKNENFASHKKMNLDKNLGGDMYNLHSIKKENKNIDQIDFNKIPIKLSYDQIFNKKQVHDKLDSKQSSLKRKKHQKQRSFHRRKNSKTPTVALHEYATSIYDRNYHSVVPEKPSLLRSKRNSRNKRSFSNLRRHQHAKEKQLRNKNKKTIHGKIMCKNENFSDNGHCKNAQRNKKNKNDSNKFEPEPFDSIIQSLHEHQPNLRKIGRKIRHENIFKNRKNMNERKSNIKPPKAHPSKTSKSHINKQKRFKNSKNQSSYNNIMSKRSAGLNQGKSKKTENNNVKLPKPFSLMAKVRVSFKSLIMRCHYSVKGKAGGVLSFREAGHLKLFIPNIFLTSEFNVTLMAAKEGIRHWKSIKGYHVRFQKISNQLSIDGSSIEMIPDSRPPEWVNQKLQEKRWYVLPTYNFTI